MFTHIIKISLILFILTSCSTNLFKKKVGIESVVNSKEAIETTDNPARKLVLKNDLSQNIVEIKNVVVKDIIDSPNVDYDFCVVVHVKSSKGLIECYIFSKNIKKISLLKKEKTLINVQGSFGRYFSTLDSFYTKIEVLNSSIEIIEKK